MAGLTEEQRAAKAAAAEPATPAATKPVKIVADVIDPAIVDSLGLQRVQHRRTRRVQATDPNTHEPLFNDVGRPVMTTAEVLEDKVEQQPILTLAEAKKLGKQNWFLFSEGIMACKVMGTHSVRRFMVSDEVYAKLCQG